MHKVIPSPRRPPDRPDVDVPTGPDRNPGVALIAGASGLLAITIGGTWVAAELSQDRGWLVWLSLIHIALGVWVFLAHGGRRITATGIWGLAQAVFVGIAGLYLVESNEPRVWRFQAYISATILAVNIVVFLSIRLLGEARNSRGRTTRPTYVTQPGVLLPRLGFALVAAGGMFRLALPYSQIWRGVAWSGVVLVAVALAAATRSREARPHRTLYLAGVAATAVILYDFFFFGGFGRIVIASMALTFVLIWNSYAPRRGHKTAVVLLLPLALVAAAYIGQTRGQNTGDGQVDLANVVREGEGVESGYRPLRFAADVAAAVSQDRLELQKGGTFANSLIFWIPRDLWPDKPYGLGYVYSLEFRPQYAEKDGYSVAALSHGEWFVNFGWAGALVQVPAMVVFLSLLDRLLIHARRRLTTDRDHVHLGLVCTISAGLLNYAWSDSFSYVSRVGLFSLVLVALLGAWRLRRRLEIQAHGPAETVA